MAKEFDSHRVKWVIFRKSVRRDLRSRFPVLWKRYALDDVNGFAKHLGTQNGDLFRMGDEAFGSGAAVWAILPVLASLYARGCVMSKTLSVRVGRSFSFLPMRHAPCFIINEE